MRHLPAIDAGPGRWFLPLAERTALCLIDLLLNQDRNRCISAAATVLATDPALALWVAFTAGRKGALLPTIGHLAAWLADHAVRVLQWPVEARQPPSSWPESRNRWGELVFESVATSLLAAELAFEGSDEARESARLAGLLRNAASWFAQSDSNCPCTAPEDLSDWLVGIPIEATRAVTLAADILAGRYGPTEIDVGNVRRLAAEAARAWEAPLPGVSDRLPCLAERMARLDRLERQFQEALEREKLESLAEFAAGAGHEINNPLATIVGRAQLLLRDETDPERRREAAVIVAQAKRAHEMIADLRLFARPPCPEPRAFDLGNLIETLVADSAATAEERSIQLTLVRPPEPIMVVLDPVQIQVALQALVRNAFEAIGREGRVELAMEADDRSVSIRVTDTGPGIAAEDREHIFDPFFSARQAGRGLGMGLSKCWRIVTNHQGEIAVESLPGKTTTFTVRVPRRLEMSGASAS
jgi:signal transduction histidine kinase